MHRLGNGLTVAVDPLAGAESVALGVYAMVGSRSEPENCSGLAHLVEHMVFKGAGKRNTRELAEAIEDVGGYMNAWTSRDQTTFHGRVLARDTALVAELLADLIREPHMAEEHLDREKDVILSEIGETVDSPDDLVNDHLFEAAFVDQPLGRSILGREESLENITREDCLAWMSGELVPSRLILSASGKVDPDKVMKLAERLFGDLPDKNGTPIGTAEFTGGLRNDRREFEQAHWCLGLPGLRASDPGMSALAVFVQALGGGTSSRLFQELREERGLAYSVGTWQQAFADTGIVVIGCAADRTRAAESMSLARNVLTDTIETLSEAEVRRAQAQMEAGLLMALETPQGRADQMARSVEVFGRIVPLEELLADLRSVDVASAKAAGAALLDGRIAISSVGARLAAVA
jgi:predicted Zn-dependent peptidase